MNKRQRKKNWNKYVYGKGRIGCDYCCGVSNPIFMTDGGMINLSLKLRRSNKEDTFEPNVGWKLVIKEKVFDTGDSEEVAYIRDVKYCWNCGRKLK